MLLAGNSNWTGSTKYVYDNKPIYKFLYNLIYAILVSIIFLEFGVELCDTKRQRVYELKKNKN